MLNSKAIGYITANYQGAEPSKLLEGRPIASLPIMGRYRLIDFPLSNMVNAGIRTVGLVMPGNYRSLIDHVGHGKDWMLDRKKGGLFLLPGNPYGTTKRGMRFLLRDIISNKTLFQRAKEPYVVLMGSNIIFNMDLNAIIDAHEASGVGITMVYVKAERDHERIGVFAVYLAPAEHTYDAADQHGQRIVHCGIDTFRAECGGQGLTYRVEPRNKSSKVCSHMLSDNLFQGLHHASESERVGHRFDQICVTHGGARAVAVDLYQIIRGQSRCLR